MRVRASTERTKAITSFRPRLRRGVLALQRSVVNPVIRLAFRTGVPDPGDALLETTGRRTGRTRLTPVCDCLEGDTFWIIAQSGRRADWVKNIEVDPRVRVKVRRGSKSLWRSGRAYVVAGDDTEDRVHALGRGHPARQLCLETSHALATDPVTVRVDLAPPGPAGTHRTSNTLPSRRGRNDA